MNPTGDFSRFQDDILSRYRDQTIPITFGVLIADHRQREAREYILNYLNGFDKLSGNYIDFFIPGYTEINYLVKIPSKPNKKFYFSQELFDGFVEGFEKYFEVEYVFTPMLVLIELQTNDYINARKIVLELDSEFSCIKRSGLLFKRIFTIAQQYVALDEFSYNLQQTYMKGAYLDSFINALDNSVVTEIRKQHKHVRYFAVR